MERPEAVHGTMYASAAACAVMLAALPRSLQHDFHRRAGATIRIGGRGRLLAPEITHPPVCNPITTNLTLQVNRASHAESRVLEDEMPALAGGQVRLRIERFAVTANTVTYATTGDTLGYWDFFPTGEPGWGCVPAMGWAEIVESRHPNVPSAVAFTAGIRWPVTWT